MSNRKEYRGSWAGLTSVKISKFLGCSVSSTKKLLYTLERKMGSREEIDESTIAELIFQVKLREYEKDLNRYLS